MPPKVRFTREAVTDAAFALVRAQGQEALNARAIARQLGCSTQPLYRTMPCMDALRDAVMEKARRYFEDYIQQRSQIIPTPYLSSGIAYLRFAREEAHLFRFLFMRPRTDAEQARPGADATFDYAAGLIARSLGISLESARDFHSMSYVFVHGLASMIVTGFMTYDESFLIQLLHQEYRALRLSLAEEQKGD